MISLEQRRVCEGCGYPAIRLLSAKEGDMAIVTKTIRGRAYLYRQRSSRVVGKVVTKSTYLGPVGGRKPRKGMLGRIMGAAGLGPCQRSLRYERCVASKRETPAFAGVISSPLASPCLSSLQHSTVPPLAAAVDRNMAKKVRGCYVRY